MSLLFQKKQKTRGQRLIKSFFFLIYFKSSILYAQISLNTSGAGGGAVVVGSATNSCDGSMLGGMRWSTANTCVEVCNGSVWNCIQLKACTTDVVTGLSLANQASVAVSTLTSSNITQATGIAGCTVEVSVSGQGSPEFRVCNTSNCSSVAQDWTSSKSSLTNNQYVQVRLTSSASQGVTFGTALRVGATSVGWAVSTVVDCSAANPPIGTFCADGTVYLGLSPDGGVKMYTTPCRQGRTWSAGACTGTETSIPWSAGATVVTGVTNETTGEANTATLAGLSNADSPYGAAVTCQNLSFGGKSDWYLPSVGEARVLQTVCDITPDNSCSSGYLHSSREVNMTTFIAWRSMNGNTMGATKTSSYPIRCVRKD